MVLFALTIFLSAALLFLLQPMLAKHLLPYFGGGAAVWTACMLFFQIMLLAGYVYAHVICRYLVPIQQRAVHCLLMLLAVMALSLMVQPDIIAFTAAGPLSGIIMFLFVTVGLPYLVLSATGPLLQHWFAGRYIGRSPYRLYALSNIGSLGGLLAYPFLLEPWLTLATQRQLWLAGYGVFTLCCLALTVTQLPKLAQGYRAQAVKLGQGTALHWLLLSAFGVVLLLAVTQQLTQNVPPVPFLWVVPLALYLLSYIIVFNKPGWYQGAIWRYLFGLSLAFALMLFYFGGSFDLWSKLVLYLVILFSGCMLCHGELARLKPQPASLTGFYLVLAAGGALGSAVVNLLAPEVFSHYWEFLLVLALIALLLQVRQPPQPAWHTPLWLLGIGLFAVTAVALQWQFGQHNVYSSRNFYGSLVVRDLQINGQLQRQLIDGTTSHGAQYLDTELARQPQSYYRQGTGAALALQHFIPAAITRSSQQLQQRHIGLVGLGSGALAAYGTPQHSMLFYEINPDVIKVAKEYFSYLADSSAQIEIVPGDARLTLAEQLANGSQQFDILVLDAFSSDSIPQHLLTLEAMQLYWQHLQSDGVLAVHVSNNYLDLTSLLRNQAAQLGMQAIFIATPAAGLNPAAQWVLITSNSRFIKQAAIQQAVRAWPSALQSAVSWTDQRSNLLQVLK
ncbi:spermidine synthase [Rheinheimera maricola]|uniref:Fused MFS/spermidine synthase n=1 Tax=Rheinheimera maricola TaxID=2793282 RepID=A0ABS7X3L0_9GAMM|nr:fused MFS/spermidine synthase [Rheinheimera maricola]MBZ9610147.1 fused MFS/spermidine synthase [Rheinheimera maricola]